jgi:hypothetical protein
MVNVIRYGLICVRSHAKFASNRVNNVIFSSLSARRSKDEKQSNCHVAHVISGLKASKELIVLP